MTSLRAPPMSALLLLIVLPSAPWVQVFPPVRGEDDARQCAPRSMSTADWASGDVRRLQNDLLCDYDRLVVRPSTRVDITMFVYRAHLDVHLGLLQMLVSLEWKWNDTRLRWDPSSYANVDEIILSDQEIWIPDLDTPDSMIPDFQTLRCTVTSSGNVTCSPVYNVQVPCGSDARRWPMDTHDCDVYIASRVHDSQDFYTKMQSVEVAGDASDEWVVSSSTRQGIYTVGLPLGLNRPQEKVSFTLKRAHSTHVLTVGVPLVVLPCLVLAQLWVDPRWPGRLLLGCTAVGTLCMYLQFLAQSVPDDSEGRAPLVVLFYRDSLLLATLTVVLTVVLRGVADRPGTPPAWLTGSSSWLLRRVPGRVAAGMLLEDDEDEDDEDDAVNGGRAEEASADASGATDKTDGAGNKAVSWGKIARLVDRIAFLALTVSFVALFFTEMP